MIIYALLVCSITAFNITQDRIYYEKKFFTWMHQFEIEIEKAEEFVHRLNIFQQNDAFIQEHNEQAHEHGYTLGHNAFSHLTWDEFKSKYMGLKMTPEYLEKRLQNHNVNHTLFTSPSHEVPESIDWVKKGAVTPVKNQLQCGSCWSFSTTGAVEGAAFIESHQLEDLSEQELVDCDHNGDMGCGGGLMDHAFQWIIQHGGLCRESDYTYIAKQQQCKPCKSVVTVSHFQDVPSSNEQALKVALAKQPVSVAIEADQPQFQFYKSGVFSSSCGTKLDHGVLAVGYGTENGEKYWKVKNSWGSSWGLDGYILLGREMGIPGGQCGIAMVPSYPTAKVVEDELVPKTLTSSATISKCGDEHSNVVNFSSLSVTPKAPKRNQPIYFSGTGSIRTGFQNASFDIAVELGGEEVYSQSGCMCGSTHLPLPLGLGDLDIHGFDCPTNVGKFHEVGVTVKLPIIAPSGDYSIRLTGTENANALFCIKVDLELTDDQAFSKSKVYEYFTNE